jgi:hypothetical protein
MKELHDKELASYWYNRYCTLVTESIPPTAEKAYLIERINDAEGKVKALEAENKTLKNIIDNFRFKQL